jgi:hypothetical protein
MPARAANPADRVLRARVREPIRFVDLTERLALKLSAVPDYTARAHFGVWNRHTGGADFESLSGVFTPLVYVEVETTDLRLQPSGSLGVRGESPSRARSTTPAPPGSWCATGATSWRTCRGGWWRARAS